MKTARYKNLVGLLLIFVGLLSSCGKQADITDGAMLSCQDSPSHAASPGFICNQNLTRAHKENFIRANLNAQSAPHAHHVFSMTGGEIDALFCSCQSLQ